MWGTSRFVCIFAIFPKTSYRLRARLLPTGALLLAHVLVRYGMDEAHVKPNGIRGGLAVSFARYGDDWRKNLP